MGCGYSRGSSSSGYSSSYTSQRNDDSIGLLFSMFGTFLIIFMLIPIIISVCSQLLNSPPKTKITDYYQPKKIDNKTSRGPYKHMED